MRYPGTPQAVAAFAIPPNAPPDVAEAKTAFDSIATRWANVQGELQDAVEALTAAKQADLQAIAKMAEQGKNVADPQAKRRKAEALIEDLRVRLQGLGVAVDEAGDRLALAIAKHRDQWLPRLDAAEADAAERFDKAVAEARAALNELRPARGAMAWLDTFDVHLARTGQNPQYAGGRLRVKRNGGPLRGEHDPTDLLDLAARVTAEDTTRRTVTIHVPEAKAHA